MLQPQTVKCSCWQLSPQTFANMGRTQGCLCCTHRSVDYSGAGGSQSSPFRQWYQGQQPWWAKEEEDTSTQHAQSEFDADTDAGSLSPDGTHHSHNGRGRYYYLMVISLQLCCCLGSTQAWLAGWLFSMHHRF